jgi:hypothetical protein
MDDAFHIAKHDGAEVDLLDQPADAVHRGHVSYSHLILYDQKEAGDYVPHEGLRTESDRQAENAGAGQDRRDVDIELAKDDEHGTRPDQARQGTSDKAGDSLCALAAFQRVEPGADVDVLLRPRDHRGDQADDDEGEEEQGDDTKTGARRPAAEVL